jgi:hypothetical protein
MSRLATTLITAQSIGTGANKGERLFGVSHALQATATAFSIEVEVTNGADGYEKIKKEVIVRYAASSNTYVAASAAPLNLHQSSRFVALNMGPNGGDIRSRVSFLEPAVGATVYVWVEAPTLETAALLTVKIVEQY